MTREIVPLNFQWYFSPHQPSHLEEIHLADFTVVDLPHNAVEIPFNHFDEKMVETVSSYVKYVEIKESWAGKAIRVRFEGVAHQAKVFVNRQLLSEHRGGYTPFDVDISEAVIYGRPNELLVVADSREDENIPPFGGVVDYLGYSGIYREVSLIITARQYIEDVFIQTDGTGKINIEVALSQCTGELEVSILEANQKVVTVNNGQVRAQLTMIRVEIPNHRLWDLRSPFLYQAVIRCLVHGEVVDEVSAHFGIRRAEFKNDGFYLNHEKIKLFGLNRHQSYPYVGYAMPKSAQYEDAEVLKYQLGVNIVRTAHYPQSRHFLDRCDQIGLLVFEEIPGWQHIGNEAWQEISCQSVRAMIRRDRNHPSVVLWGVRINESPDNHDFYVKTNAIARSLDPTRQTAGVRNLQFSEFLEDVYTYNDFTHRGNNRGLEAKRKITKNVPYLVTEFNGHMFPTKRYDDERHRLNQAYRHLNVLNAMLNPDNMTSGAIGWAMCDYNTHQEFGSGDRVCYHGVMDMFRLPKLAAFAYSSQTIDQPVLELSSTMNSGDYAAGELPSVTVFTNLDYVRVYKNDEYIGQFYPDSKKYPYLKHPPIVVDDFIGETLMKREKLSRKDAEMAKEILRAVGRYANHLPLLMKLKTLYLLKKYKLSFDQGVKMFFRYMSGWGSKTSGYRFEGYKDDRLIKTVIKENNYRFNYLLETGRTELKIEDTYDTARFVIKKINQHGEIIPYSFNPLEIKVSGSVELIGPGKTSLQGGVIAFWVKTRSRGKGQIGVAIDGQLLQSELWVL
jgi:beta-galactosidase